MASADKLAYGSYEVLKNPDGSPFILGQGSFGVTYKARHVFLGRINALKVIREDLLNRGSKKDHEEINRFLEEARAVARLHHPGIATVHDCGLDEGVVYYAMEYCNGGTLKNWSTENGPMPWAEARRIALQAASALHYAHENGLLHRDIKPANIMLNGQGKSLQAKLIDFGLATSLHHGNRPFSDADPDDQDRFRGNILTASPEQILEKPLDPRSDLFSLGITLWWLLLGRNPFGQMKGGPVISDRLSPHSYASSLPADFHPEARHLLERLLEKDPEKRISTAKEVVALLRTEPPPVPGLAPGRALPLHQSLPQPLDIEKHYRVTGIHTSTGNLKIYNCICIATGQAFLTIIPDLLLAPEACRRMRIAASRKLDLGAYAFRDWCMVDDRDAFVVSKPQGTSLLSILRNSGPARLAEVLPFLTHLARCFEASQAWTTYAIQFVPEEMLVRFRNPNLTAEAGSWTDLDPGFVSCLPTFNLRENPPDTNDSTVVSLTSNFAPMAQFAAMVYRILSGGGVPYSAFFTRSGYKVVLDLSEQGNALIANTICAPESQPSCCHFIQLLAGLESLPIIEITPLIDPPDAEDIENLKSVPVPEHITTAPPQAVERGHQRVAELERQLLHARRAAEEKARVAAEARRRGADDPFPSPHRPAPLHEEGPWPVNPRTSGRSKLRDPEFARMLSYRIRIAATVGAVLLALALAITALILKSRPEKAAVVPVVQPPRDTGSEN